MLSIISLIAESEKGITIVDITKKLQINRSTLRHYLKILKKEKKIKYEPRDDLQGRPVYVHIDKETVKKEMDEMRKGFEEYLENMKTDKTALEIIEILKEKKTLTEAYIMKHIKEKKFDDLYITKTIGALTFLKEEGRIVNEWRFIK